MNPSIDDFNKESVPVACNADDEDINNEMALKFNQDMYRDIEDVFNKKNSRNTGKLEILTSYMLISPQNSSTKNLSIQISEVPIGSEQPIHAHEPEQCYYIIKGKGLMIIENETREVTSGDAIYIPSNKKHGIKNIIRQVKFH